MDGETLQWGCCTNINESGEEEKAIKCLFCGKSYHYDCISLLEPPNDACSWKCPSCSINTPKVGRSDSTPIRNISMTRGSKRQAVSSPSPPPVLLSDKDDLHSVMKAIIREEFNEMLVQFNKTIISTINIELEPVRKEMQGIRESISFMNKQFEDVKKEHESYKGTVRTLELENLELKTTVEDLNGRLVNLEQQSRANNLEVQCVPENKNENVYNIISQLARVVKCEINEKEVLHCTRIAKSNTSSTRPRSIIVQLSSPRVRDQLLAAIIKYNKANPQEKLNSAHLGYAGTKSPIYVAEHLSPTNRALHAATRIKAKEKDYKYVWVRSDAQHLRLPTELKRRYESPLEFVPKRQCFYSLCDKDWHAAVSKYENTLSTYQKLTTTFASSMIKYPSPTSTYPNPATMHQNVEFSTQTANLPSGIAGPSYMTAGPSCMAADPSYKTTGPARPAFESVEPSPEVAPEPHKERMYATKTARFKSRWMRCHSKDNIRDEDTISQPIAATVQGSNTSRPAAIASKSTQVEIGELEDILYDEQMQEQFDGASCIMCQSTSYCRKHCLRDGNRSHEPCCLHGMELGSSSWSPGTEDTRTQTLSLSVDHYRTYHHDRYSESNQNLPDNNAEVAQFFGNPQDSPMQYVNIPE